MKRIYPLLIVIAVMALGAVDASACVECRHVTQCVVAGPDALPAAEYCTWVDGCCMENGYCEGPAPLASFASQYTVASVERLDEQRVITVAKSVPKTAPSSSTISQNR
ncbi:MAG TPA: hypothetical protein VI670_20925 [Thermoanaerobaculia bacterium]|jgi:hypothetical protein